MCTVEGTTGTVSETAVLHHILSLMVAPICAKRFHGHNSGHPTPLNRHYNGNSAVVSITLYIVMIVAGVAVSQRVSL